MTTGPLRRAVAVVAALGAAAACADEFGVDPDTGRDATMLAVGWPGAPLVGQTITLRVAVEDEATGLAVAPADVDWTVAPATAAEILHEAGDSALVRLLRIGPIQLRASLDDPSFDTASVAADRTVSLAGVTLTAASSDTLRSLGDAITVQARGLDASGASIRVEGWEWSASANAMVDGAGDSVRAVALGNGRAVVRASHAVCAGAACSDSVVFEVSQLATQITIEPASALLTSINQTLQLTATLRDARGNPAPGTVAWSSTADTVASVGTSGLVTATGNGEAAIVAQAGGFEQSAAITVDQAVATVQLQLTGDTLAVGDTLQLVATVRDSGGTTVADATPAWTTTDALVASVDTAGRVIALARGSATIRATAEGVVAGADLLVAAWALAFDGGDHVQVASAPAIVLDSIFTLEAWVRPRAGATSAALLAVWDGTNSGSSYGLYLQGLVPTAFIRAPTGNTVDTLAAPAGISQNAWHHVAFVYDRGTATMYVDGDSVAAANAMSRPKSTGAPLRLGADAQATPAFLTGDLDELRVWATARSGADVAASMNVRLQPAGHPGLRAYWSLSEGDGNPVDAVSGLVGVLGGAAGPDAAPQWTTEASPVP